MKDIRNIPGNPNTGGQSSPKTNQDFNKKKPNPGDPDLKIKKDASLGTEDSDLLEDETADPGDADGNGNLINESDDKVIGKENTGDADMNDEGIDDHVSREDHLKNPFAREI